MPTKETNEVNQLDYGNGFVTIDGIDMPIYIPQYVNGSNGNFDGIPSRDGSVLGDISVNNIKLRYKLP